MLTNHSSTQRFVSCRWASAPSAGPNSALTKASYQSRSPNSRTRASRVSSFTRSRDGHPSTRVSPMSKKTARRATPVSYRRSMLDFEQLAFIEKWRQRASRGIVVALDGRRGDTLITVRVGEGPSHVDMRGRDTTGAVRKARLTLGDRVTMAIEYSAREVGRAAGRGVTGA